MELNKISGIITRGINDLLALVFPNVCEVCGDALVDGEDTVCLGCLTRLPLCRPGDHEFNIVHQRLAGHAPIERVLPDSIIYATTGSHG